MSKEREELRNLIDYIVAMADEVGLMLASALQAFREHRSDALQGLAEKDEVVDRHENANDTRCLRILALYQPEADDLRTVLMAFKINNDLERIGDHALNVAERAAEAPQIEAAPFKGNIVRMGELAQGMLSDAVTAFVAKDTALAKSVIQRDDEVDALFQQVVLSVLDYEFRDRPEREAAVATVFAAKEIERVADLCTNLAEDVIFMAEGTLIKHEGAM